MAQRGNTHPKAWGGSLLLHLGLLGLLFSGLLTHRLTSVPTHPVPPERMVDIVQAVNVDERKVEEQLKRLRARDAARNRKLSQEEKRLKKLKSRRNREAIRLKEARKKRRLEERKRKETKRKAKAEARAIKAKAERAAKAKKAEAEAASRKEQQKQRIAERKRKAEEQRLKELTAERAKREAENHAAKALRQRRQAEEEERKTLLATERQRLQQQQKKQAAAMKTRYQRDIQQKVLRMWRKPPGSPAAFSCRVQVRLLPGGAVQSVRVTKSCGSKALDLTVEHAVRRASPLPIPQDITLFEYYRNLSFTFTPK